MIDILQLNVNDTEAIGELVDLMHQHCDVDQCEQFLSDLYKWNRHHATAIKALEASPEWQEIRQWREFVLSLSRSDDRRAVA